MEVTIKAKVNTSEGVKEVDVVIWEHENELLIRVASEDEI